MYEPFNLSGKVALVTGGNGGIGLGMADALAQAGADVVVWGTNAGKNSDAEKTLRAHGVRVLTRKVDVSREDEVVAGMADAVKEMGRIDAVFANAGIGGSAPFAEMTTELFHRVHAVNEDGVFLDLPRGDKTHDGACRGGRCGRFACRHRQHRRY